MSKPSIILAKDLLKLKMKSNYYSYFLKKENLFKKLLTTTVKIYYNGIDQRGQ